MVQARGQRCGARSRNKWRGLPAEAAETKAAGRAGVHLRAPLRQHERRAEQEYFSDGISEDITTDLSKISALEVVARNTAFGFKGQSPNVMDVAKQLSISHVLEGSVRKAGGRVRINAQLIDGSTGKHLWADRFDRDLTDIFEIQDEISKAIVEALKVKLLPKEKSAIEARGTASVEAYNTFPDGRVSSWISGDFGDPRLAETAVTPVPAGNTARSELCRCLGPDGACPAQAPALACQGR